MKHAERLKGVLPSRALLYRVHFKRAEICLKQIEDKEKRGDHKEGAKQAQAQRFQFLDAVTCKNKCGKTEYEHVADGDERPLLF